MQQQSLLLPPLLSGPSNMVRQLNRVNKYKLAPFQSCFISTGSMEGNITAPIMLHCIYVHNITLLFIKNTVSTHSTSTTYLHTCARVPGTLFPTTKNNNNKNRFSHFFVCCLLLLVVACCCLLLLVVVVVVVACLLAVCRCWSLLLLLVVVVVVVVVVCVAAMLRVDCCDTGTGTMLLSVQTVVLVP